MAARLDQAGAHHPGDSADELRAATHRGAERDAAVRSHALHAVAADQLVLREAGDGFEATADDRAGAGRAAIVHELPVVAADGQADSRAALGDVDDRAVAERDLGRHHQRAGELEAGVDLQVAAGFDGDAGDDRTARHPQDAARLHIRAAGGAARLDELEAGAGERVLPLSVPKISALPKPSIWLWTSVPPAETT